MFAGNRFQARTNLIAIAEKDIGNAHPSVNILVNIVPKCNVCLHAAIKICWKRIRVQYIVLVNVDARVVALRIEIGQSGIERKREIERIVNDVLINHEALLNVSFSTLISRILYSAPEFHLFGKAITKVESVIRP